MSFINELLSNPLDLILDLIVIIFVLSVHEVAHGYAAYKLGDPTAKSLGRLSLNPLKHLDPIGFICMLFFHFGWAKPVPVNSRYFKKPRRDMAITALAGPLSNILMAFIGVLLYRISSALVINTPIINYYISSKFGFMLISLVFNFFITFASLNLYLGVFNLIPVLPLDGSRILFVVLPDKYYFGIMRYEQYIQIAMLLLLWTGVLSRPLGIACDWLINGMDYIVRLIPGL